MKIPRLVIAGTSSGVGKTTITCCIITEMLRRNIFVSPFKVGPDYIDPHYLGAAAHCEAHTLDSWLMGDRLLHKQFVSHSTLDVSVIEGVMGYYDGYDGTTDRASTYHISSITRSPVVLIIDASKAARSVAATALGFRRFKRNSRIAGVILNKIGSDKHRSLCTDALLQAGIPVLGSIPRDVRPQLEARHLGLYSTISKTKIQKTLEKIAKSIRPYIDMDAICGVAFSAEPMPEPVAKKPARASRTLPASYAAAGSRRRPAESVRRGAKSDGRPVIAVALDDSFNFYYQDNLDALRREGADLVFFSPSFAKKLPACDGLYIGGGFPEVLAAPLERNRAVRDAIRRLGDDGAPIYAECGGLMYLARHLVCRDKKKYEMVGLLSLGTVIGNKVILNYTSGVIDAGTPITGSKKRRFHGHEFHYSTPAGMYDGNFAMSLDQGVGISGSQDGLLSGNTFASYGHLYFDTSDFASNFVANCARYMRS